ncbi:MAG: glycosyltransferase [Ginsengibacter sp.]
MNETIHDTIFSSVKRDASPGALFSILIPTWNNLDYLKLCIDSIKKNSSFKHEIIIHINEGSDETLDWIEQQKDLSYSHSSKNVGVCYALNFCSTLATTDYIVYLNDDMYVCPGWDKYLYEEIKKLPDNNFFLSATAIESKAQSNCSIEKDYGSTTGNFNEEALLAEFNLLPMKDWQGATWPPNVVHKCVWELAGKYSTEFTPGMYSDPDFSMKLWQMDIRLFKGVSKSRVYHFGSVSLKKIKKNKGYYQFITKWGMTSGTFSKYFLKRGQPFMGISPEPEIPFFVKIKSVIKQFVAIFMNSQTYSNKF